MEHKKAPLGTYAHHERHWHYVHRHRTRKVNHTTREILIGQMISILGAVVAGYVLDLNKNQLTTMVGAFLILPGVFDLGGSVAGAMAARLNHRLADNHAPRLVLRDSLLHALFLICAASVVLAVFGASLGALFFDADYMRLFVVTIVSAVCTGVIGLPIVAGATYFAFRRGVDADNFIGPIETSVFDTLTVITVTILVGVIG